MKTHFMVIALLSFALQCAAEDIELYIGDTASKVGNKPQVLIIFDNSGSMRTTEEVKTPYDPNIEYPAVGGNGKLSEQFLYFTKGVADDGDLVVDSVSESRRFLASINSCDIARQRLASVGYYTGHLREYRFNGNAGSWQEISDSQGETLKIVDCWDDISLENNNNAFVMLADGSLSALPDGYPADGLGTEINPQYYTATLANSNTDLGSGQVVTLYSANYLRWSQSNAIALIDRTRLDIAKDTVTNLIESAPSVDFGLQIFNLNYPNESYRNGGRVIFGIQEMTASARSNLVDLIDLEITAETNTPLCETLYEASRYFGGKSVRYGNDDANYSSWYVGNTPPRDTSTEDNGVYLSPYSGCSNEVYVIMITDGSPTQDRAADQYISAFPNVGGLYRNNYLASLAQWMHNNDLNDSLEGKQTSTLFTIGFSSGSTGAKPLLAEAAKLGGGTYYDAEDPSVLLSSLQSALQTILEVNTSFTAPSVASNNFDRTETLDSVYYAMFVPDHGARWQGNLKKLKVVNGKQVDRDGNDAIDDNGNIDKDAKTFWSTSPLADGNNVRAGGVAQMLQNKNQRTIYSDLGTNGALTEFTENNAQLSFGSAANLASEMGITEAEVGDHIQWAKGIDVEDADNDGSTTDNRPDIFGDPLHSKPLIVNYGGSADAQDIRIIVGTNSGALHMFKDSGNSVDESWAFMPKEFLPQYRTLKNNFTSSGKVYGIDGAATSYLLDVNGDGIIDSASGDKAWIFFGLRRGGSAYYGIDISNPNAPQLLWRIDHNTSGFNELGQSWSQPKVAYSTLNIVSGEAKPVLIFGAGYDTGKDNQGVGVDDSSGRGIYMVDAYTGSLKWSVTPNASSATNSQFSGFSDGIAASVAVLDSDSDGIADRLYAGDTGGNVWRVDMPGNSPSSANTPWTVHKLAELGGVTLASDRRFFSEPSIVRTFISDTIKTTSIDQQGLPIVSISKQERPYEAILLGSGDRSSPTSRDSEDKFFMIKDPHINTTSFVAAPTAPQLALPAVITTAQLYDYTNDPFGGFVEPLSAAQQAAKEQLEINVSNKKGWFVDFTDSGEKSTAEALAINGVAYFTSFTPADNTGVSSSCQLADGSGKLYAIDLALGTTVYDWRTWDISAGIPDTPSIIITKDTAAPCVSDCENLQPDPMSNVATVKLLAGRIIPLDFSLKTARSYLYVTE